MRRLPTLLAAAITMLVLVVVSANAQVFNWCHTCFMVSWVDIPAQGPATTVSSEGFVIAGWGFVCEGGGLVERVEVFYADDQGFGHYLPQPEGALANHLYRPDVQQVYATACPGVPSDTGWHYYISNPPPPGIRNLWINVWRGPFLEGHTRTVIVE